MHFYRKISTCQSSLKTTSNIAPENHPFGKGQTSSKPQFLGFHVSFRLCNRFLTVPCLLRYLVSARHRN